MKDIKSLSVEELKTALKEMGEKPFRAAQIFAWLHEKRITDFSEMTNISKGLQQKLSENFSFVKLKLLLAQVSKEDDTRKFLFELPDGNTVETVWMKYKHGNSVCISSQVGCRMGCKFCASTLGGLVRSLDAGEMLEQIYEVMRQTEQRVDNIVVMGIGEPFDNYENLLRFIRRLTEEGGYHLSARSITVSTCGIVPYIKQFAKEGLPVTLALSLHATTDEKRKEIMPIAFKYTLAELKDAMGYYFTETGRRITLEYALIGGVNDSEEEASRLAAFAYDLHAHVNLIPVNPVKERGFTQPDKSHIEAFCHRLEKKGVRATVRREMGRDIDGACGQLRRKQVLSGEGE